LCKYQQTQFCFERRIAVIPGRALCWPFKKASVWPVNTIPWIGRC
jgi:hypothetical protein